jgi:hypothetical protein
MIDRCNALSDNGTWTVLNVDVTNLATTTRGVEGAAAIEFDKTDGAANSTVAGVYKTLTNAINFSTEHISPSDFVVFHVYLSSVADVSSAFIRLGNAAANYYEYQVDDSKLQAGYNRCAVQLSDITTFAGTYVNWNAMDYIAVGLNMDAETDALADICIDDISISPVEFEGQVSLASGPMSAQMKAIAESTVPNELNDGDVGDPWFDTFMRQVIAGYDLSSGSLLTTPVAASPRATFTTTSTQLTAAGSTASINMTEYDEITCSFLIASIDTNVVVRLEGNNDNGANWTNMNDAGVDTTITANGLYAFVKYGVSFKYVRFTFVSEAGGAAATIDCTWALG